METQKTLQEQREEMRKAWAEQALRNIDKKLPKRVELTIKDCQPRVAIESATIDGHTVHIDLVPTERKPWITLNDIEFFSLKTPEKTYQHWPNREESWTDTTRWLSDVAKPIQIAKKAVQMIVAQRMPKRYLQPIEFIYVSDFIDSVWNPTKMVVDGDKIKFEATKDEETIRLTYQYEPEGPTVNIEYEDGYTFRELKAQLTPGILLHQHLYEQLVSYTVRFDLDRMYRLVIL